MDLTTIRRAKLWRRWSQTERNPSYAKKHQGLLYSARSRQRAELHSYLANVFFRGRGCQENVHHAVQCPSAWRAADLLWCAAEGSDVQHPVRLQLRRVGRTGGVAGGERGS